MIYHAHKVSYSFSSSVAGIDNALCLCQLLFQLPKMLLIGSSQACGLDLLCPGYEGLRPRS